MISCEIAQATTDKIIKGGAPLLTVNLFVLQATSVEGDECPLHVKHPPTGEEFALGCGICRNAHTF